MRNSWCEFESSQSIGSVLKPLGPTTTHILGNRRLRHREILVTSIMNKAQVLEDMEEKKTESMLAVEVVGVSQGA